MNEKLKELEVILTDFDNKLTDFYLKQKLAEVQKQKKQVKIMTDITRLITALSYEKLTACDEDSLKFLLADWKKSVVEQLIKLKDTI